LIEGYQLEGLESLALPIARKAEGCNHLEAVKIARAAKGNGPNWYVCEFVPMLDWALHHITIAGNHKQLIKRRIEKVRDLE
jgi:hypothetical protein